VDQLRRLFSVKGKVEASRLKLFQAAYSWCHDRALAEDMMQDTLTKALASKSSLKEPKYLDTWLFRILINTWHDFLRKQKDMVELDEFCITSTADVVGDYQRGEIVTRVRKAVSELPIPLREVISLADLSGFKYQQIANILDIPVGTVMSRLFRARKKMEQLLYDFNTEVSNVTELRKIK